MYHLLLYVDGPLGVQLPYRFKNYVFVDIKVVVSRIVFFYVAI